MSPVGGGPLRLRSLRLAHGRLVDVTLADGRVHAIDDASVGPPPSADDSSSTIDLSDHLLLPALAEHHAHLDKALTADAVPNPDGDLPGAIEAWLAYRTIIDRSDYVERASRAVDRYSGNGVTHIRTHVDIGPDIGTVGLEALLEVKATMAPLVDIEIVGLTHGVTGPNSTEVLAVLDAALEMGLDVVGGVPHIEADPGVTIDRLLERAASAGRAIDLHADENLDPTSSDLDLLAQRVVRTGFEPTVTASHCVALSMKPRSEQARISELAAQAGITVVTLPQTNLYLQGRGQAVAPPRALTAIASLQQAGVNVVGGGDNLQDPFCPVGRADPLETAALLVMAGHQSPEDALRAVTATGDLGLSVGDPADLVAIAAESVRQAVADAPADRRVIKAGVLMS